MTFALVGNQNCGKTALFNVLTGSNQRVGNFPGVTVEQKIGIIKTTNNCSIVDLPGIYSIRPYSEEEIITRNFLLNEKPFGIINIIDATNIERNLYLTLQLLELQIPMIVALNMMDEVRNNKGSINIPQLSKELGVPVIPISAIKNEGISELVDNIIAITKSKSKPSKLELCSSGPVHRCIHSISHLIEDRAMNLDISPRFCATKIIEEDISFQKWLNLNKNEIELIEQTILEMEDETGLDKNAALANMRYNFIEKICAKTVIKPQESKQHKRSIKIDQILTNKYLALPIFFIILFMIFWLTFNVIGSFLSDCLTYGIDYLTILTDTVLTSYGINPIIHSLIIDGIFAGVGSILSFLPIIVVLFFFLSILEDTGYMARVAFVMDKLLRKIGLSGKSFVPMLIGFGCTVPAIMATRTLSSERDRKMTILLTPYISCSAKIPIYAVFCSTFFPKYAALVMIGLYIIGIILGIIIALLLKNTIFKGNPIPFIMELPNYRLPSIENIVILIWDKAKDFLERAFTIIFIATIIIWFLQKFDAKLNIVENSSSSLLALISRFITPVFTPLGFGDWRVITALVAGLTAKEAIISTLSILLNVSMPNLNYSLYSLFTPLTAFSFLIFTLLYTPCIAAIATTNKELSSPLKTLAVIIFQCTVAWITAFIFFKIGAIII